MSAVGVVQDAVWTSDLDPAARLIVLALSALAQPETGEVEPARSPSLSALANMTGLSRSTVCVWLNALDDAGWVTRTRGLTRQSRTAYALHVGRPIRAEGGAS